VIAIVAWANIAVAALWGWGDVLAYLTWVFHRPAGAGGILAVQFARAFVTIAAGLGSWERRRWARLWLLYASAWTLVVDAAMIHPLSGGSSRFSAWDPSAGWAAPCS